jgi:type II secretory pathway pseudopilin PulG
MKTPILLKFLQKFAASSSPDRNNTVPRKNEAGFTLLELLVIVILLGTLAAIAAPGWLGFINRQRVRTVNDRVFQSLRTAQSEAKRTKRDVTVTFDKSVDPPRVTFNPPLATGGSEQKLDGGGEIKAGTIALSFNRPDSTNPNSSSIVFDYQGNLTAATTTPFIVAVAPTGGGTKQCAIVATLIGGMRTAEGSSDCVTLP